MAHVCQRTALHADGMDLCYVVGNGAQCRNRAEGHALVVHVESCHDDPHATVCQFVAHVGQPVVEELRLVDAHDIGV